MCTTRHAFEGFYTFQDELLAALQTLLHRLKNLEDQSLKFRERLRDVQVTLDEVRELWLQMLR